MDHVELKCGSSFTSRNTKLNEVIVTFHLTILTFFLRILIYKRIIVSYKVRIARYKLKNLTFFLTIASLNQTILTFFIAILILKHALVCLYLAILHYFSELWLYLLKWQVKISKLKTQTFLPNASLYLTILRKKIAICKFAVARKSQNCGIKSRNYLVLCFIQWWKPSLLKTGVMMLNIQLYRQSQE